METAKLLIERDANPGLVSTNGSTALHFAAHRGNDQVAELLLLHAKIDVDSKDSAHMTPLHLACVSGNTAISKMLLDRGADIRAKSTELMTPLHTAVYNGNSEVAAMILEVGVWPLQNAILANNSVTVLELNKIYLSLTTKVLVASRGLMLSALVAGSSGPGSSPGGGHCAALGEKTLNFHSASLHPGVQMGTGKFNAGGNGGGREGLLQ